MKTKTKIQGQVMYMGPHVGFLGLYYHKGWLDGVEEQLYPWFDKCPALRGLIVPVAEVGNVRKELNFDYAHNMKGSVGRYVTFYREVQKWLAAVTTQQTKSGEITYA